MLLPRILTVVVGIPLLLFLIHAGGLAWAAFTTVLCALCAYEYGLILAAGSRPVQRWTGLVSTTVLAAAVALSGPNGAVLTGVVVVVILREMFSRVRSLERLSFTLFGILLTGWLLAHLALVRDLRPDGEKVTFLFFASVWIMDTSAYAVGKTLGRHHLAAGLSPKKTWEGAIAGFIGAVGTAVLMAGILGPQGLGVRGAAVLGVIIGICGQLSDLAESLVKRAVGAKDSGTILPGHGGILDRFDSFLLTAPAVYYYLILRQP
jgi:phosphatidate cytidylyltransferase